MGLFGGDSSSTTQNLTKNIDQRLMLENGGVAATASDGSVVNITTHDAGSIKEAFGLGNHALDDMHDLASASLSASNHTAEEALQGAYYSIGAAQDAYAGAAKQVQSMLGQVKDAYSDARTGYQQVMTLAGLAVVAMVGFMAFKNKG